VTICHITLLLVIIILRRPGAETVVSTEQFDSSHLGTLENLLASTPGVYSVSRGSTASGLYSIRGSDIATDGPRNGRGVRAYIDGVPLGRTEAGLTVSLIDLLAAEFASSTRTTTSLFFS
jgi:iron complex outermembrane recepter protein